MEERTALFVGRFQPLHKGHLHVLKEMFGKYRKIVIVVGSINKSDEKNPFSFEERKKMLNSVLKRYRGRYTIIGIPDQKSNERWTELITKNAKFDVVITRNPIVKKCLKDFEIIEPPFYKRDKYNATNIRNAIKSGKDWKSLVPKEIIPFVKKKFEKRRIRIL